MSLVPLIILAPAFALAAIMSISRRRHRARIRKELSRRIDLAKSIAPPAPEPARVDPFELPSDL